MSTETPHDKYYFNVRTREVEQGPQSMAKDRLGPYDTYAQAAQALDQAHARSVQWDEEEAAEDEWGVPPKADPATSAAGGSPTGIDLDAVKDEVRDDRG